MEETENPLSKQTAEQSPRSQSPDEDIVAKELQKKRFNFILLSLLGLLAFIGVVYVGYQLASRKIKKPTTETVESLSAESEEESESGEAGSEPAEWVKESRGWIRGGSRSSQILVKPSKQVLKPGEQFAIAVGISDFFSQVGSREQEKVYQAYFRLHRISKPNETLREKQVQVKKPKGEIYGGIQPFIWTIKAPQKPGKYTYRVITVHNYRYLSGKKREDNTQPKVAYPTWMPSTKPSLP